MRSNDLLKTFIRMKGINMIENLKRKIKWVLCLIIGFLTFNSISVVAVENTMLPENVDNYFLTQEHILKSPELYNFIKDTEKGVFPEFLNFDKEQKKDLVILIYKLFDSMWAFDEDYWEQKFSNEKFDLLKTYFIEYPHKKDETYYWAGKNLLTWSGTNSFIKSTQENLRDKNLPHHYLYIYVNQPHAWSENIAILKKHTSLSDDKIKELANIGYFYHIEENLKQIVSDVNNASQIKDKNEYLFNYLLAGSAQLLNTNEYYFRGAENTYFKKK